ncbi:Sortase family protein [Ruminococcaceae bacterium YRB3002]|nr:Sortase family protein [Ruminococcaceae bacterium YRB3002]
MNKRMMWGTMSAVMFISAAVLIFYFFWANGFITPPEIAPTTEYTEFTYPSLPSAEQLTPEAVEYHINKLNEDRKGQLYVNPVNFEELQASNPDIIGWLYMTKPLISQPILRSSTDDAFYLSHNAEKKYDRAGSLFVEHAYNGSTFDDNVTVIYGHRMSSGAMFGSLQSTLSGIDLSSDEQFIVIYTPDGYKIYQICATIPHDKKHLMYYNNFDSESGFNRFIKQVYNSRGSAVDLNNEARPVYGDKIIILSTCLRGDRTQRFLVIAKQVR